MSHRPNIVLIGIFLFKLTVSYSFQFQNHFVQVLSQSYITLHFMLQWFICVKICQDHCDPYLRVCGNNVVQARSR